MNKLDPNVDGASKDILQENVEKLQSLFPEVFTEGKVDFDALRETLGEYVEDKEERYSFTWHGKANARRIAQTPSTGTLRPCPEESVNWDTTQNLFIEGDNLEVLKLLQKSYHNKVNVIYIDPPYNTGNEFIYPDNYKDNLDTYRLYTGQIDGDGLKVSANTESAGRYHTNWLNMIYPRLKLARNLLTRDGVLLISIDEHEFRNLRKLTDEIMGEENFVADLVWEKTRKNDARLFSVGHEYMLVYARDLQHLKDIGTIWRESKPGAKEIGEKWEDLRKRHGENYSAMELELREWYKSLPKTHPSKKLSRYKHIDSFGPWRDRDISWPGGGGPRYDVLHPETGKPCAVPESGWRFSSPESMQRQIELGLVVFREDHTNPPFRKAHLFPLPDESATEIDDSETVEENGEEAVTAGLQVMPSVIYKQSQVATKYLRSLMGKKLFDNPKDHEVLARLIQYMGKSGATVLDFFAGSCATADAVLQTAQSSGNKSRFMMVQLPEPCAESSNAAKEGYANIAEIGKERIRRAAASIRKNAPEYQGDLGFKVFKLDASNIKPWDADFDDLDNALLDSVENIKKDRSEADVLYELLLKYGLDLAVPIEERTVGDKTVYCIGLGALVVCLDPDITLEVVEAIGLLKDELSPESAMRVVFKDGGFKDDVVKTNAIQELKRHGVDDVRSL